MNADLKFEIAVSKALIKELERIKDKFRRRMEREQARKTAKIDALLKDYPTYEEAHEAWGMDFITNKEFEELEKLYKDKESLLSKKGVAQGVHKALSGLIKGEKETIRECEWEMLSEEEKERRRAENEEWRKKHGKI